MGQLPSWWVVGWPTVDSTHSQAVYRGKDGAALLYVRSEQRPGATAPQHLFVTMRDRVVLQRWLPEIPEEFEPVIDVVGRAQLNDLAAQLEHAKHDRQIVLDLLTTACGWLPAERVRDLKQRYREAQP